MNFAGATTYYRSVFGGNFSMLQRFSDGPPGPGQAPMNDVDKNLILHIELPILGGHMLMGTDAPESMGFKLTQGNNIHLNLEPDTRAETQRLFDALAVNGKVEMPLAEMFWGGFFGHLVDQFGIGWMFNCTSKT